MRDCVCLYKRLLETVNECCCCQCIPSPHPLVYLQELGPLLPNLCPVPTLLLIVTLFLRMHGNHPPGSLTHAPSSEQGAIQHLRLLLHDFVDASEPWLAAYQPQLPDMRYYYTDTTITTLILHLAVAVCLSEATPGHAKLQLFRKFHYAPCHIPVTL